MAPASQVPTITTSYISPARSLRGDGDADNPGDVDGNGDRDPKGSDYDSDAPIRASYDLPDGDDETIFGYGRPASGTSKRAIASVAERYYAAASSGDGITALCCSP